MSVRKNRKGGKTEVGNETFIDLTEMKKVSRSTRKTRLNESVQIDQLNESTRVTRRTRATKLVSEDEDSNKTKDEILLSANITQRKRRKEVDLLDLNSIIIDLDQSVVDNTPNKKNESFIRPMRARKARKDNEQSEEKDSTFKNPNDTLEMNETSTVISAKKNVRQSSSSSSSKKRSRVANLNEKLMKKLPPTKLLQLKIQDISTSSLVTPENSPIVTNISPHRTKKTPKRFSSPVNIGSPKTHSLESERFSKVPRKLSIVGPSPSPSEKSSDQGSPVDTEKTESSNDTLTDEPVKIKVEVEDDGENVVNKLNTSKERLSGKFPKIVFRLSKSPKIMKKKTPSKSPKSKSLSPKKLSPEKRNSPTSNKLHKTPVHSPKISDKMDSPIANLNESKKSSIKITKKRSSLLNKSSSMSPKRSPKKIQLYEKVKTPKLILERLSLKGLKSTPKIVNETPVVTPTAMKLISNVNLSPKRPKSTTKTRSPITDSGTPLRPVPKPKRLSSARSSLNLDQVINANKTPEQVPSEKESTSSRDKIRRSLNLSLEAASAPTPVPAPTPASTLATVGVSPVSVDKFYKSSPKPLRSSQSNNKSMMLFDVTNPLISEDDDSFEISGIEVVDKTTQDNETFSVEKDKSKDKLTDTYSLSNASASSIEKSAGEKIKKSLNGTYELDEPKTPALKRKRSTVEEDQNEANPIQEPEQKRSCRVRFASTSDKPEMLPLNSSTPANKSTLRKSSIVYKSPHPAKKALLEKKSLENNNQNTGLRFGLKTPVIETKRLSLSLVDIKSNQKLSQIGSSKKLNKAQQESVNRLSKPRLSMQPDKKEIKAVSASKIPNFAEIHQKRFAAMESIVDSKKKIANRHRVFLSGKSPAVAISEGKKSTPADATEATNGNYNRFGFKIRKNDAVNVVKRLSMKQIEDKKAESRLFLKGIRTNRRFELQMKMRNIKP